MAGKLTASFILKLEDQLSGGLAKIEKQLKTLGDLGKQLGLGSLEAGNKLLDKGTEAAAKMAANVGKIGKNFAVEKIEEGTRLLDQGATAAKRMAAEVAVVGQNAARAAGSMRRMASAAGQRLQHAGERIGAIGAVAAGYSVLEPTRAYAEQENALRHIAITEKKSGPAVETEVARLNANLNHEALLSGQNSRELAKAYNFLITTGMSSDEVDHLMPAHAKAATAYNISSDSMGQAVFALADTMKIKAADMPSALASMAYAAKEGHFSVEDFSHFLPTVSASMSKLGMTGRTSADTTFAALETVRKSTGDAGTAATDFKDLLDYIVSPFGKRSFARAGIDLPQLLQKAEKEGQNPLDTIIAKLAKSVAGKSPVQTGEILGEALRNQQARDAAMALIRNKDTFLGMREKFGKVDDSTINTDFETAFRAPEVQMRIFNEQIEQLNRRLGQGFAPVLVVINKALGGLITGIEWLDKKVPGLASGIMLVTAGFLLLVAAVGAISFVLPAVVATFALLGSVLGVLFSPIGLVIAALALIGAAAYDIIENWATFAPFFQEMWNGIKTIFRGFINFVKGWIDGDWLGALYGLEEIWAGLQMFFDGEWKAVESLFGDFVRWVDSWTGGAATKSIQAIKDAWGALREWFAQLWKDIETPFETFMSKVDGALKSIQLSRGAPGRPEDDLGLPGTDGVGVTIGPEAAPLQFEHTHRWENGAVKTTTTGPANANMPALGQTLGRP